MKHFAWACVLMSDVGGCVGQENGTDEASNELGKMPWKEETLAKAIAVKEGNKIRLVFGYQLSRERLGSTCMAHACLLQSGETNMNFGKGGRKKKKKLKASRSMRSCRLTIKNSGPFKR